jgi:hypothetical protein
MFDIVLGPAVAGDVDCRGADAGGGPGPGPGSALRLRFLLAEVGAVDGTDADDAERVALLRALEELKAAAAAAQAQVTAAFADSQEAAQAAAGVPARRQGAGVAAQVGLAKRESPTRARRYVGWARLLTGELPHTLAVLRRGGTTEWRALLVARETLWLSAEHRAVVDAELAGRLEGLGDRQVEAEARRLAYRLDPQGFVDRARRAERDRRVGVRPAPDAMARLSALLPVGQGVAAYAALRAHADALIAAGDGRGRGQIMADTLVQRITGQATADGVPVGISLVMTDATLFNRRPGGDGEPTTGDEPAHLDGYGPVPADLARRLVRDAPDGAGAWLRRLYADPETGRLVAMESRGRRFEGALRDFLVLRDQVCRTPWCGAPIRHADHVMPVADGGATHVDNGQGLCEACNYAKQAPGWRAWPGPEGADQEIVIHPDRAHLPQPRPRPTGGRARRRAPRWTRRGHQAAQVPRPWFPGRAQAASAPHRCVGGGRPGGRIARTGEFVPRRTSDGRKTSSLAIRVCARPMTAMGADPWTSQQRRRHCDG